MKKVICVLLIISALLSSAAAAYAAGASLAADDSISGGDRIALTGELYFGTLPSGAADETFSFADGHTVLLYGDTLYLTYGRQVWEIPVKLREPADCGMFDPYPAGVPKDFVFIGDDGYGWYLIVGIKTLIRCGEFKESESLQRSGEYALLGGAGDYKPVDYAESQSGWKTAKSGGWLYTISPEKTVYVVSKTSYSNGAFGDDGYLYWIEENRDLRRSSDFSDSRPGAFVTSNVSGIVTWPGDGGFYYIRGFLRTGDEGSIYWLADVEIGAEADAAALQAAAPVNNGNITVTVNGETLAFPDEQPQIQNGVVMVPIGAALKALDAAVSWDAATETITAIKDGITLTLTVGQTTAYRNGKPVSLDAAAVNINGRVLAPARIAADAFGAYVYWDEAAGVLVIEG